MVSHPFSNKVGRITERIYRVVLAFGLSSALCNEGKKYLSNVHYWTKNNKNGHFRSPKKPRHPTSVPSQSDGQIPLSLRYQQLSFSHALSSPSLEWLVIGMGKSICLWAQRLFSAAGSARELAERKECDGSTAKPEGWAAWHAAKTLRLPSDPDSIMEVYTNLDIFTPKPLNMKPWWKPTIQCIWILCQHKTYHTITYSKHSSTTRPHREHRKIDTNNQLSKDSIYFMSKWPAHQQLKGI